jgi:hypothetical protein
MLPLNTPSLPAEVAGHIPVLTVTVPEACRISGYSRSELYRRMASGDLEGRKIGRSIRVVVASLERSVAALPRASFKQSPAN